MIKTDFINLYEELCVLNEDTHDNFEKNLAPKIKALKPKLDKAIEALNNPNYVEIQEILESLISGFKVCFSVSKQIATVNQNDQAINVPFDEALSILNRIEDIIFRVEQGDTALDKYLKGKPTAWTTKDLKDSLKYYEKQSDVDISKLDFSAKEVTSEPATDTQQAEPKNAKLNRARQNNSKIMKAFKEVGLPTDDLVTSAKNKNGRDYKKASDKLNKLRKTLFGEAFEEELDNPFDQEF